MRQKTYFLAVLFALFFSFGMPHTVMACAWGKKVYLATYPRSGNHWMRYLIEEVTNTVTGSVYCDGDEPLHLPMMFPWGYCPDHGYEGNRPYPKRNDVVMIKTHFPHQPAQQLDNRPYIVAIRIVRHPVDSCYSFYTYNHHAYYAYTHLGCAQPDHIVPKEWIEYFISSWQQFQYYWNNQPNVLTIRYEDLYYSPESTLKKVIDAIGYPAQDSDIKRAVAKYPPRGGTLKYFDHFHPDDLALIESQLHDLIIQYKY